MKLSVYKNKFSFYPAYATEATKIISLEIEIIFCIGINDGLGWIVKVPNKTFSVTGFNIFKPLLQVLESQTVGMEKYNHLKTRTRALGVWRQL